MNSAATYKVVKLMGPIAIDANWDKSQWQAIDYVDLKYFMGKMPEFLPLVKVKMMYDSTHLYAIFQVNDKYVRCLTTDINGPVWDDSCVEFFFSPDSDSPGKFFNLETNCGGTALMYYNVIPRKEFVILKPEDIKEIEIAHSLPEQIHGELIEPITWTVEYKIPFHLLEKYATVSRPAPGVKWRANFYKIADKTSNAHYITWSLVNSAEPDFHLPAYFGNLIFE